MKVVAHYAHSGDGVFIDPYVYRIGVSSNYDADFHDIIKGGRPANRR
jgi:hypothetical protein